MVASCIPSSLLLLVLVVTAVSGANVGEFYPVCLFINLCDYHDCLQESLTTGFPYPTCSMAPLTMVQAAVLLSIMKGALIALI